MYSSDAAWLMTRCLLNTQMQLKDMQYVWRNFAELTRPKVRNKQYFID